MIVGRTLGWQLIRSTAFEVRPTAIGYRFAGRGSGHGVGMCVIGSARMAAQGRSVTEILDAYFPGVPLGPIPAFRVDRSFAVVKPGSGLGKRTCPAWARWSAGRQPL
jgi:peptidoglycan hydrolase-like amidase